MISFPRGSIFTFEEVPAQYPHNGSGLQRRTTINIAMMIIADVKNSAFSLKNVETQTNCGDAIDMEDDSETIIEEIVRMKFPTTCLIVAYCSSNTSDHRNKTALQFYTQLINTR